MAHNKLYRNFIILQEDEKTHSSSGEKAMSGYAKIEAKGDKCKISFYAQNLKKEENYSVVLICYKKDMKQIVDLGSLKIDEGGKGEKSKEYYVNNIAGMELSCSKISGAAVCSKKDKEPVFVMYGFMNGEEAKEDWKSLKILKCKDEEVIVKKEYPKEKECKKEEKKEEKKKEEKKKEEKKIECKKEEECVKEEDRDCHKKEKECMKEEKEKEYIKEEKKKEKECQEHKEYKKEEMKEKKCTEKCVDEKINYSEEYKVCHKDKNDDHHCKKYIDGRENIIVDFNEYEKRIEESKEIDPYNFELRGGIGLFFKDVAKDFEEIKDRYKDIRFCKWYKVNVNSLDDMLNISNYNKYTIAYYPMINYYPYIKKYGHFLMGYKCDNKGELKYIVYGVPGRKDIDDQPYAGKTGFVTWMNSGDGNGFWLMFYDYKKSTVVVPMK